MAAGSIWSSQGQGSDQSCSCELSLSSSTAAIQHRKTQLFNPLYWTREQTCILLLPRCCPSCCTTVGAPKNKFWRTDFFFFAFSLGPHPLAYGGSQARGREQQLPAYVTATAPPDPSCVCNLHHSSGQCQILNPLSEARD